MDNNIIITKEDINKALGDWGFDFFNELEKDLGRELKPEDYKEALLHCLGYVDFSKEDRFRILADLGIEECLSKEEVQKLT